MPTYDYLCPENGEVLEVQHRMSESVRTWGELCALAGADAGSTALEARVKKQIAAPALHTSQAVGAKKKPAQAKVMAPNHKHGPGCGCC